MEYVYLVIAGIVVGLLGKFLAPGDKDNTPLWLTVVCGVGGILIGDVIFTQALDSDSAVLRWLIAVAVAAVLVVIASTITGRNTSKRRRRKDKARA